MATTPDPAIIAFECADRINRLPEQLSALFKKGASAQERLDSIGTECLKIRVGIEIVTNYIERNQPHLLDSHTQRIATILGNVARCAAREGSEEPRKTIAILIVVAHRVAIWLRGWAEEQRATQGQPLRPKGTVPHGAGATAENGTLIPTDTPSGSDDKEPNDLMYLNVVCANYVTSKSSIYRHIKAKNKKLKNWPELSGNKFRLSKAEVELLYEPRAARN